MSQQRPDHPTPSHLLEDSVRNPSSLLCLPCCLSIGSGLTFCFWELLFGLIPLSSHCFTSQWEGEGLLLSCLWFFVTPWTVAHQTPPSPWDSSGKNIGVGCHSLRRGIFPTQGLNLGLLGLLHCRRFLYYSATRETGDWLAFFQFQCMMLGWDAK